MSILEKMTGDDVPVKWSTVLLGWYGPGKYDRQLSVADIAAYAQETIEAKPEQPNAVLKLAGAHDDETEMVETSLKQLAALESDDKDTEVRKWRLYLLKELEPTLSYDPISGLIQLTEFWEKFDYPDDSPHVVQGRSNDQDPQQYYTTENFLNVRKRHQEWMKREEAFLKGSTLD
jgi:hypothetical protein